LSKKQAAYGEEGKRRRPVRFSVVWRFRHASIVHHPDSKVSGTGQLALSHKRGRTNTGDYDPAYAGHEKEYTWVASPLL
jgi:hypothetical protein